MFAAMIILQDHSAPTRWTIRSEDAGQRRTRSYGPLRNNVRYWLFVMATLKQRFEAFIQTVDGFEDIDTRLKGRDLAGENRADYLLHGRTVIVEQKSLEVDPAARPQNYADKLMARGQLIAFGKVSTTMFSDDLQREFVLDLGKNLDAIVAKADKQTADTRTSSRSPTRWAFWSS